MLRKRKRKETRQLAGKKTQPCLLRKKMKPISQRLLEPFKSRLLQRIRKNQKHSKKLNKMVSLRKLPWV